MEVLKEVILLGVGACLPIIIVACIVYGIWRSFTARHEYIQVLYVVQISTKIKLTHIFL